MLQRKYCINKKEQVKKKNKKELLVGRDTEINKITEILCRFSKQNVLIIGDHGVGKTALIEGFVQKVLLKQIPDILSGLLSGSSRPSRQDTISSIGLLNCA